MKMAQEIMAAAAAVIVEDLRGPTDPVKEGEEVIGFVPKHLRGLWAVANQNRAKHDQLCTNFDSPVMKKRPEHELQDLKLRHDLAAIETTLADTMLMIMLREAFIKHMNSPLGLRKDWQVVKIPSSTTEDLILVAEVHVPQSATTHCSAADVNLN